MRIAILATHPIQHFVPFYRALARQQGFDTRVFYCSRIGVDTYFDREMNTSLQWNTDLTSGYEHVFLPEADSINQVSFRTINNPSIGDALSNFSPNVLVVYGYSNISVLRAIAWSLSRDVSVMMVADSALTHARPWYLDLAKKSLLPVILNRVAAFLTVGDSNEAYWRHYGISDDLFFRVPFTIDESTFLRARYERHFLSSLFRSEHGISKSDVVFLTVGKLSGRKRQCDAIDAIRILARNGVTNVRLVVAGDGVERKILEENARIDQLPVIFLGFVNLNVLPAIYAAADVLVHPSEQDPHPLVCSEAACVGLPIIASDRVGAIGPTDIVRPGVNAMIHRVADVEGLADLMTKIATLDDLRRNLSAGAVEVFATQNLNTSLRGFRAAIASVTASREIKAPRGLNG